jgi:hypothetical protein
MGIDELVASQPTEEPNSDDNVMDNEGTSAPLNVDGEQQDSFAPEDNANGEGHNDGAIKAMQKRIDKLTAKSKSLEEDYIKAQARAEAYENMQQQNQPQTLQDLDINGLNSFIAKAENDPELEEHLPEARLELQRKLVQEELRSFKEEQKQMTVQQQSAAQTNQLIAALSGDKLNDQSGEYYHSAVSFLNDLESDQYKNINVNQVLAVALAENEYLKKQAKGPSMPERIAKNRNRNENSLQSNNRASNANSSSDLAEYLKENEGLYRSNQAGNGSLKGALKRLSTVQGFREE